MGATKTKSASKAAAPAVVASANATPNSPKNTPRFTTHMTTNIADFLEILEKKKVLSESPVLEETSPNVAETKKEPAHIKFSTQRQWPVVKMAVSAQLELATRQRRLHQHHHCHHLFMEKNKNLTSRDILSYDVIHV